jgi:chromate reductase, NAD(P)H dehydrogenase (quinone)
MITVVSSTNRPNSMSLVVAKAYHSILESHQQEAQLLDLQDLPADFAGPQLYSAKGEQWRAMEERYIIGADKLVFVIPEYQGSFPGVLKSFLDGISPRHFNHKKAAIVGVSDGRAGNLRGQDHLTGILHYLKMHVHFSKPKLSQINTLIDPQGQWLDASAERMLGEHALDFMAY